MARHIPGTSSLDWTKITNGTHATPVDTEGIDKNRDSMFIRMDPCKIQVLFPLAPE